MIIDLSIYSLVRSLFLGFKYLPFLVTIRICRIAVVYALIFLL